MGQLSDIEAEKRLLAGLLLYPDCYATTKRKINEEVFTSDKCKFV